MRIGIYYDFTSAGPRPVDGFWQRLREQVELADALGYDSAWFAERHFTDDAPGSLEILLGHLAHATRALRLGGFKILPLAHPIHVAEAFAVVDLLSGGRLNLGFAADAPAAAFRAWKTDRRERETLLWEGVEILRHAWTSDEFQYLGRRYRFPGHLAARPKKPYRRAPWTGRYIPQWQRGPAVPDHLAVTPKPLQEPHPPLWILAGSDRLAADAGRRGLSCVLPPARSKKRLFAASARFRQALARAGRSRAECEIACICDLDEGKSVHVVETLKEIQSETDMNHLLWRIPFPALGHEEIVERLGRFAREVHPMMQS